jgi:hypothetical protein
MSALVITHRRMKTSSDGTHKHVGWVQLSDGTELTRKEVLAEIKADVKFLTLAANGDSATVISAKCGLCGKKYLRTDADPSKADNLDDLPTFKKP